ncbi:hypothetical protein [Tenuifilum osseticum]|uniref:hypothetical protein n=1 Tax=Tenuifilum osseticum TaxID=3374723 RepID=UPI0034E3A4AD
MNELSWITTTFFGKSIVDSFNFEKDQQWSGCIIDDKLIEFYKSLYIDSKDSEIARLEYLEKSGILIKYNVPLKSKVNMMHYAIDWPKGNKTNPTEDTIKTAFMKHNKSIDSEEVKIKIENTIKFLNYSLK